MGLAGDGRGWKVTGRRVREVHHLSRREEVIASTFYQRGQAAQRSVDVDELLEVCRCGHVRAAHVKPGQCCEAGCSCLVFGKAVR